MDSKELMIGDWVYDKHYNGDIEPIQIHNIYGTEVNCKTERNRFDVDEIVSGTYMSDLQPIPLTPEILEKNGLKIDKYKGGFFPACFKEDENYDVEIEMKDEEIAWSINCGEYWIKRLNYVHELQHALRLFGINKEIEI